MPRDRGVRFVHGGEDERRFEPLVSSWRTQRTWIALRGAEAPPLKVNVPRHALPTEAIAAARGRVARRREACGDATVDAGERLIREGVVACAARVFLRVREYNNVGAAEASLNRIEM